LLKFEAVRILAKLEIMVGNVDAAIAGLESAAKLALQMRLPRRAIQVYGELLRTEADGKRNFARADALYATANELLRKEGEVPFLTASLLINRGAALWAQARYKESEKALRRSLVALDRLEASPQIERARSAAFSQLALVMNYLGRRAEARELNERAIDQIILSVGPKSPELVRLYANLADNDRSDGDVANAKELLKKAMGLARELKWEEGHALNSYIILSWIEAREGHAEEARRLINSALAWAEKHEDERSVMMLNVRMVDGFVYRVEGKLEGALKVHESVLQAARLAKSEYMIAATQVEIGRDLEALGRIDAIKSSVECSKPPPVDVPEKRLWCAYFEALASEPKKTAVAIRRLRAQLVEDKCNRLECTDARDTANRWMNERIAKQPVFQASESDRTNPPKTVARQGEKQPNPSDETPTPPAK
jgi:tetratricopeptide (TPR) repeat protein